jgi:hypothetical protein
LLNAIINFIKTDLKKAIEELNKNAPDLVKKVLDDIQQALPPQLQSLIMGSPIILINNQYLIFLSAIKFSLSIDVSVKVSA